MDRKRLRLDSKAPSVTCEEADIDRISQLSDDILVAILSFLSLKEAACTSVVSSRWLELWKHNPCLNFDVWSSLNKVAQNIEAPSKKRPKYMKWVNGIIRSHRALTLKEFRICFRLTQSANKVIARWLEFAFVRHVQILELDMSEENEYRYNYFGRCTYCAFPEELLTLSTGGASTSKRHSNSSRIDFKCLKVLSMKRVDVTSEAIEFFLSNCSSLEKLVVDDTYTLLNVEVCGPSLVLKHLKLVCCHNLKSIKVGGPSLVLKHLELVNCHSLKFLKVSAPKLTSLILPRVNVFLLENVPLLVDVNADCCYYGSTVKDLIPELSCCVSHLEFLTLKLTDNPQGKLSTFSELPKLKKLVIKYDANAKKGLMGLTSLIRASPHLQEFVLEIMCLGFDDLFREVENTMIFPHHHLKVFEFRGYVGHSNDLELLAYIVENCVLLDKIIIDSRGRVLYCPEELYERTTPGDFRQQAVAADNYMKRQLEARVPQHIELSDNRNIIGNNDRISKLPDEILVSILSLLPVKEAARTSVLSPVWINLWKQSSCLNFDPEGTLYKIARRKRLRASERRKYIKWVNLVIESNKATALTEFRICFDLNKSAQKDITPWVEYAFAKHVQRLVLDLSPYNEAWYSPHLYLTCSFPDELLYESSTANYRSLKSLCLKCVSVSDEAIHLFLSNCPLLEKLIVHDSAEISNLEVCGSSLALKHLEVRYCCNVESIKASALRLTSLSVTILDGLLLEKVPMLVELDVACEYGRASYRHLRPAISCRISQLETLILVLHNPKESVELCNFPEMPKLKKLVIEFGQTSDESLIALTSLIRASPYLQEFVLALIWLELSRSDENSVKFEHQHLKIFRFSGYYGRSSDVELVRSFVENCVVLEKITIDPNHTPKSPYALIPPAKVVAERNARNHAKQHLEAEVPKHIKLVIL